MLSPMTRTQWSESRGKESERLLLQVELRWNCKWHSFGEELT